MNAYIFYLFIFTLIGVCHLPFTTKLFKKSNVSDLELNVKKRNIFSKIGWDIHKLFMKYEKPWNQIKKEHDIEYTTLYKTLRRRQANNYTEEEIEYIEKPGNNMYNEKFNYIEWVKGLIKIKKNYETKRAKYEKEYDLDIAILSRRVKIMMDDFYKKFNIKHNLSDKSLKYYYDDIRYEIDRKWILKAHCPIAKAYDQFYLDLINYGSKYYSYNPMENNTKFSDIYHFAMYHALLCDKDENLEYNDLGTFYCGILRYKKEDIDICQEFRDVFSHYSHQMISNIARSAYNSSNSTKN